MWVVEVATFFLTFSGICLLGLTAWSLKALSRLWCCRSFVSCCGLVSRQVAQPGFAREAGLTMALCHSRISMDKKDEKLSLLEDMAESESDSSGGMGGDQGSSHSAPRTDKTWAKMTGGVVAPPPRHK